MTPKIYFEGVITSIQPRIRLVRSFDERHHNYLGYVLSIHGSIGNDERGFIVAVGKGTHAKHQFQVSKEVSGECMSVVDSRKEIAEFYRVSKLKVQSQPKRMNLTPPPWLGIPPDLQVYRERGHRRLASITYDKSCMGCIWGCKMPVEIIVDHWNPTKKQYRFETFCYGPKSCELYKPGPMRKVPGRKGMIYEEPDWVDEEETAHRGQDD